MNIAIDLESTASPSVQLVGQIKQAILRDEIRPGDALPSVRQLAGDLRLGGAAVARAYRLLERDSMIRAKGRRSAVVHERAAARLQLELDNARKTKELEEARHLQLSLLPSEIPRLPELELAASMTTATEVGGDYYDFAADAGGLTVAVGDAVGHGARAGALVAATKGIFSLGSEGRPVNAMLERFDEAFGRMRMKRAAVALLLARFDGSSLEVASAGMPPPLLYRTESAEVEEVQVSGMPLGSPVPTRRRSSRVELQPNDTVLFMSDGFPELVLASGEPFGYERVRGAFADLGGSAPGEIVSGLEEIVRSTSGGALHDDVTFVAVRRRASHG